MDERSYHRDNVPAARRLRKQMTNSERLLWNRLRDRGLNGWKVRRQHPIGPYVLDFYCSKLRVAIEVDGGIHRALTHPERDATRQEVIQSLGIRLIRISADEVENNVEAILAELHLAVSALAPTSPIAPAGSPKRSSPSPVTREKGPGDEGAG